MIKDTKNEETSSSNAKDKNVLNKITANSMALKAIAVIIGILIVVIPTFLFAYSNYVLVLLLIGGIVTALIAGGKSEDGALNGVIMGLIAALIVLIFRGNFFEGIPLDLGIIIFEMSGAILILALFGLIGGVIGISIRDLLIKAKK
ncbi:MAG TPA: DUF5518 domain-containing protein [Methanobacterium sp.]|nr:DUF5518 domain-containing protein [Methanobacterium sp.]